MAENNINEGFSEITFPCNFQIYIYIYIYIYI